MGPIRNAVTGARGHRSTCPSHARSRSMPEGELALRTTGVSHPSRRVRMPDAAERATEQWQYASVADAYGVPEHLLGKVQPGFYGLVGRVTVLGALVEQRLLEVACALERTDLAT